MLNRLNPVLYPSYNPPPYDLLSMQPAIQGLMVRHHLTTKIVEFGLEDKQSAENFRILR